MPRRRSTHAALSIDADRMRRQGAQHLSRHRKALLKGIRFALQGDKLSEGMAKKCICSRNIQQRLGMGHAWEAGIWIKDDNRSKGGYSFYSPLNDSSEKSRTKSKSKRCGANMQRYDISCPVCEPEESTASLGPLTARVSRDAAHLRHKAISHMSHARTHANAENGY
eukprot:5296709-Pleurochrysis_carterae.AAC.3